MGGAMRVRSALLAVLLTVFGTAAASGQAPFREPRLLDGAATPVNESVSTAGQAFLLSALLPGAGQFYLGQQRWVPYLAVEAWAWTGYVNRRRAGTQLEARYKDLAWAVARRVGAGVRRDTTFEYYESLTHFRASGAFDADARQPGLQPETDPTTFNGMVWQLAQALFLPAGAAADPGTAEYAAALEYYQRRAVRPDYAWSWGLNELEREIYAELIRESDEALREATRALGLILANHVLSAVDALVTARLRHAGGEGGLPFRIETGLRPEPEGIRWRAGARVTLPNRP
jgi:hypothetical protein